MNLELVKRIERLVPPYRIVSDAGNTVHREVEKKTSGVVFYTNHPAHLHERLYISGREFVESRKSTGFYGGGAFDYLAACEGSVEKGVRVFFSRYRDKIRNLSNYEEDFIADYLIRTASRNRRGFDFMARLSGNNMDDPRLSGGPDLIRKMGAEPGYVRDWLFLASVEQMESFFSDVCGGTGDYPFDPSQTGACLVIPFFNYWSNISHMVMHPVKSPETRYTLPLNPAKISWAGLHSTPRYVGGAPVLFFDSGKDALPAQAYYRDRMDPVLCLVTETRPDFTDASSVEFESGTAVAGPRTNLETCAMIKNTVRDFKIRDISGTNGSPKPKSWTGYIASEIERVIQEDGQGSPRVSAVVSAAGLDGRERAAVSGLLDEAGLLDGSAADELSSNFFGTVYKFRGASVEETKHGYLLSFPNQLEQYPLTNFTLTVDWNTIMGDDSGRIVLSGDVRVGETVFPYQMDRSSLSSHKTIEEEILRSYNSWIRQTGKPMDRKVPVITSPEQAKMLTGVVGRKCADAPYREGFNKLGWVGENIFLAPYWTRRELSLEEGNPPVVLDDFPHRKCYRFTPFPGMRPSGEPDTGVITREIRVMLNTLVGWVARGALDYPQEPAFAEDSPKTRNVLKAICAPFGQVSPLELKPSSRKHTMDKMVPNLENLPLYARCADPGALSGIRYPMWILSENGPGVDEPVSREGLVELSRISYNLVNKIMDWLCSRGGSEVLSFNRSGEDLRTEALDVLDDMAKTMGSDPVIRELSVLSPIPLWVEVFKGKHDDYLRKILVFDLDSGKYIMKGQSGNHPKGFGPGDLVAAARNAGVEVVSGGGKYWLDRGFMESQMGFARKNRLSFDIHKPKNPNRARKKVLTSGSGQSKNTAI